MRSWRLSLSATAAKNASTDCETNAPMTVASATARTRFVAAAEIARVMAPVTHAVIDRLAVYDAHRKYGRRSSAAKEAAATISAARGPNSTAANRVGTR